MLSLLLLVALAAAAEATDCEGSFTKEKCIMMSKTSIAIAGCEHAEECVESATGDGEEECLPNIYTCMAKKTTVDSCDSVIAALGPRPGLSSDSCDTDEKIGASGTRTVHSCMVDLIGCVVDAHTPKSRKRHLTALNNLPNALFKTLLA